MKIRERESEQEINGESDVVESRPKVITTTKQISEKPAIRTERPQRVFEKKKTIFRTYQIVWYILGVIETLLIFRFLLKALGANPFSGFTFFIYSLSDPFALPFNGILGTTVIGALVFEWSTIIAIIVYALIAWGIVYLLQIVKPVTPDEVEEKVDNP